MIIEANDVLQFDQAVRIEIIDVPLDEEQHRHIKGLSYRYAPHWLERCPLMHKWHRAHEPGVIRVNWSGPWQ